MKHGDDDGVNENLNLSRLEPNSVREFVFSNLRLTVSEDLLLLSIQESPHLFRFQSLSLNFLTLLVTYVTANNGFPRSIMTD